MENERLILQHRWSEAAAIIRKQTLEDPSPLHS